MEKNEECELCNTKKVKTIQIHVKQDTTLNWLVNECCSLCHINHESCKISLFHQITPLYCEVKCIDLLLYRILHLYLD